MSVLNELLSDVALPRMARVRQNFPVAEILDIAASLRSELRRPDIAGRVQKNMRIAVAVGSRGMAEIPLIVKVVVAELKKCGAIPFIVPAMGSHGGATTEGQKQVLASLGVTEASADCPIVSSMDVVKLGELKNGLPVLMDKAAAEADGIVVINRIKPHSAFSGANESGLVKMIAIGLGKQKGADSCHALGFKHMADFIVKMAKIGLHKSPLLFGIATIENAYDRIAKISAIPAELIIETEQKLLLEAKNNMPRLLLQPIDVLIVDLLGKEFSGSGMDPSITGRASTSWFAAGPQPSRIVVLDITTNSHGNATGMGMADVTTRRLYDKIDFEFTYANVLTATTLQAARIPIVMNSDRLAIRAAIKTCNIDDRNNVRMVRIENTLHIQEILVSECMLCEVEQNSSLSVIRGPANMVFDAQDNLADIGHWC